jgi:hypothetical protein
MTPSVCLIMLRDVLCLGNLHIVIFPRCRQHWVTTQRLLQPLDITPPRNVRSQLYRALNVSLVQCSTLIQDTHRAEVSCNTRCETGRATRLTDTVYNEHCMRFNLRQCAGVELVRDTFIS